MQFEWAVKHEPPRNVGGITSRIEKLLRVLKKPKWTSKSPDAKDVPLILEWIIHALKPENSESLPNYITET